MTIRASMSVFSSKSRVSAVGPVKHEERSTVNPGRSRAVDRLREALDRRTPSSPSRWAVMMAVMSMDRATLSSRHCAIVIMLAACPERRRLKNVAGPETAFERQEPPPGPSITRSVKMLEL